MADAPLRLALVTNIPAPYRVPVFDRVAATPGIALRVLYGALREPDRDWDLPPLQHEHVLLPGRVVTRGGRHIHVNPAVWRELQRFAPQVVLTTGYNPTHLAAFVYARTHGAAHVAMTDGTPQAGHRRPVHPAGRHHGAGHARRLCLPGAGHRAQEEPGQCPGQDPGRLCGVDHRLLLRRLRGGLWRELLRRRRARWRRRTATSW
jgi:hypothetical protein